MNVNCNRDPLTCHCDYHSGRIPSSLPVLDLETYSRVGLHIPAPWQPSEAQMLEAAGRQREKTARLALSYRFGRPPVAPGVLIKDDEARVHVSREVLRIVGRWAGALALVAAGAAVMYAEGQRQAMPGPGFAIGLTLILAVSFLFPGRRAE